MDIHHEYLSIDTEKVRLTVLLQEEEHIRNTRMKAFSVGQDHPWQRVVPFTEGLVKSPTALNNIDTYCLSNTLTSSDTLVTVFTA